MIASKRMSSALLGLALIAGCADSGSDGAAGVTLTTANCEAQLEAFVACGGDIAGEWKLASWCAIDAEFINSSDHGPILIETTTAGAPSGTATFQDPSFVSDVRGGKVDQIESIEAMLYDGTCPTDCPAKGDRCECTDSTSFNVVLFETTYQSSGAAGIALAQQSGLVGTDPSYCQQGNTLVLRQAGDSSRLLILTR